MPPAPPVPEAEAFEGERRHLAPGLAPAHRLAGQGAVEVSAEGAWVTLSDGRRLLDLGNYAVPLLGHRHPAVIAAVHGQLRALGLEVTVHEPAA